MPGECDAELYSERTGGKSRKSAAKVSGTGRKKERAGLQKIRGVAFHGFHVEFSLELRSAQPPDTLLKQCASVAVGLFLGRQHHGRGYAVAGFHVQ